MNSEEFEEYKCRICLDKNIIVNWNDALNEYTDMTYKDCYYKYTQLEYFDEDTFSSRLCGNCSNGLEYVHTFVSKAIEANTLLKEEYRKNMLIKHDMEDIKFQINKIETIVVEETKLQPVITDHFVYEDYNESAIISAETKTSTKLRICNSADKNNMVEELLDNKDCRSQKDSSIQRKASKINNNANKTHMKNRERKEICNICRLKFYDKATLRIHLATHSKNREKIHKCDFCTKSYFNKSGLNIHRRIHLGKTVSCNLCSKVFVRKHDLDTHMIIHSATREKIKYYVRCEYCDKSIISTNFKSHTARHLNKPLMKCSICNQEYFRRESCVEHLKKKHDKSIEEVNDFIILLKKERLTHLFLQQNTNLEVKS